jgi:hypothetical protein
MMNLNIADGLTWSALQVLTQRWQMTGQRRDRGSSCIAMGRSSSHKPFPLAFRHSPDTECAQDGVSLSPRRSIVTP